jgi:outer membrane lipoprotein-sorting protein
MNALPPSLDRFGSELEDAVHRDLGSRRRRRRAIRGAAVLAVVAAAALGLLSVFGAGGPSVVERAAAALQYSDNSILHYQFDATQQNGDGTVATWSQETWQLLVPPYTRRQIAIDTDAPRAESVSQGDLHELYDASSDTIYIATSAQLRAARMPKIEIVSESKLEKLTGGSNASVAYEVGKGGSAYKVLATEAGARRLRRELTRPEGQTTGVLPEEFRSQILALLRSGRVRVVAHVTVDGRDAIELESLGGKSTYYVDPSTYDPIQWTTKGTDGGVTYRFSVFEELPVDGGSMQLLDLQDQHSNARVVRGASPYIAAESRLYPRG